jgi:hypothetical protein
MMYDKHILFKHGLVVYYLQLNNKILIYLLLRY